MRSAMRQELSKRWETLSFRTFTTRAADYYENGSFGCKRMNLRHLAESAKFHGRWRWNSKEDHPSWEKVLIAAMERVRQLEESRFAPAQPWLADMVIPLCSPKEIHAVNSGLALLGRSLPPRMDDADGWPPDSQKAHRAKEYNRLRGHWRHAKFRVFIYMVCGTFGLLGKHIEPDASVPEADVARLAKGIFADLPEELLRLFTAGRSVRSVAVDILKPQLHLAVLEEEVPTGDAAVYLHHLARASAAKNLGNITLLLHPDFLEHIRSWKVSTLFQALVSGSWPQHVDFLYLGWRHEGPVTAEGRVASHLRYHCDVEPWKGGKIGPCDSGYNPILLQNLWRMAFGRKLDPVGGDDLGGYDFSQLLVTRRAISRRSPAYWRYLSQVISARASFELLPGTRGFISRRTDLSVNDPFNKGVCAWFEHIWHMLFDPSFFPDDADKETC
ncbi:unnamed protein product [Durusdinium trenchii]|uniref:Cyanocobalamin reductase (cyanide-eliminating) n=1 Tax=Durusdinium trenchii TaxID=1381693 RepID=A0ABP0S0G9_9DINO